MSGEVPSSLKIRQTLSFRIGVFLIPALIILFALSTIYVVTHSTEDHLENLELTGVSTTEIIARNIEHDMSSLKPQEIQQFFEELVETDNMLSISLTDSEGVVRFAGNPESVGLELRPERLGQPSTKEGMFTILGRRGKERILTVRKIFENEQRCTRCHGTESKVLGSLLVDYSFQRFEKEIVETRNLFIFTGVISILLISVILYIIYRHFIQKPLSSLITMVDQVKKGDMDSRVALRMKGEFMVLGDRLNKMASNLQATQKKLEALHKRELTQSEKLASLGQLASSIAHEIRNPLAGIQGVLEVLLAETQREHPHFEALEMVLDIVKKLDETSVDLLSFARPTEPRPETVNLNHILNEAISLIIKQADEQKVELELDLARNLQPAWLDPDLSKQVFLNLMLNAIQAMPDGGTLTIKTWDWPASSECLVCIRDTGTGIAPEDLPNVFRPFFTRKEKGTGLGLHVTKQIIESQGGEIRISSELGIGTEVTVIFPYDEEAFYNQSEINENRNDQEGRIDG